LSPSSELHQPIIEAKDVSLAYRLPHHRVGSLKEYAIRLVKGQVSYEHLWALRDVSFELQPGQVLGVIGHNGAGKSTLMKIIARVLPPTRGRIVVRGAVAPMIELGAGFNTELTAMENIVLYGALLGRDVEMMRQRAGSIAEWAGVTDFLDVPVRSFSTGMLARLGFAVATDVRPDLLVVDEVLSVGDAAFKRKSEERIHEMIRSGTAVVLVSHSLETVRAMADIVLWLDHGQLRMTGSAEDVVPAYEAAT
jgi:ABC-2 type transport system ATP-binding protein